MNNNPGIPLNFVPTNPLDLYWQYLFNPGYPVYDRLQGEQVLPTSPLLYRSLAPFVYVAGMIGYAVEVPLRVLYLASAIVRLVCCDGRSLFDRFAQIVQAVAGIFASVIGVACPLAGYEMDRLIYPNRNHRLPEDIHNRQAAQMLAYQNQRQHQATANAAEGAQQRVEAMAADEIDQLNQLEQQLNQIRLQLTEIVDENPVGVQLAEIERNQVAEEQIIAAQRDTDERLARLEGERQHRLAAAQDRAGRQQDRLAEGYEAKFQAFKTTTLSRLRRFGQQELEKEQAKRGSSPFLAESSVIADSTHKRLVALYGAALELSKRTLDQNLPVVPGELKGLYHQATLGTWFLLSMDQVGSQLPSPLVCLLSEVLIGLGDGFGSIAKDYDSVLETFQRLEGEENRVERLLRVALGQEGPDSQRFPQLRFQLGRIIVQIARSKRLLAILERQG